MLNQTEIRDQVTHRIIEAFEADHPLLPLRRPWRATAGSQPARHSNVASRKAYRGVNPLLLELHALPLGLTSRWWATFNQWHHIGCRIRKRPPGVEAWGCRIIFYKALTKKVVDEKTGDEDEESYRILTSAVVFSADQVEGDRAGEFQVHEEAGQPHAEPDFAPAEELIAATGADIRFGGDRAYYRRPRPAGRTPGCILPGIPASPPSDCPRGPPPIAAGSGK